MARMTLLAAIVALALPGAVLAQAVVTPMPTAPAAVKVPTPEESAARARFRAACSADIAKHCADSTSTPGATPDQMKAQRGKLRACLATHNADLSAACKTVIIEREAAGAARKS